MYIIVYPNPLLYEVTLVRLLSKTFFGFMVVERIVVTLDLHEVIYALFLVSVSPTNLKVSKRKC